VKCFLFFFLICFFKNFTDEGQGTTMHDQVNQHEGELGEAEWRKTEGW
jgi:hypothetical protein